MDRKKQEDVIIKSVKRLRDNTWTPWKLEVEIIQNFGVSVPENFKLAALARQRYIEENTGENFVHIHVPEKPYKERFLCQKCQMRWELDVQDSDKQCSFCSSVLDSVDEFAPLVANYVGGEEAYYSYSGSIEVKGSVKKKFTNLLLYGTGLGPIGVTRGSFFISQFGGAEVCVSDSGRAARCIGLLFRLEKERERASVQIESFLPDLKKEMNGRMQEFGGSIDSVEFVRTEIRKGFLLYVDFSASFKDHRGHGDVSQAVGFAKKKIEQKLRDIGIIYDQSVIAQGYDGDLKPSPRNKRGRYASASIRIPQEDFKSFFKVEPGKFLSFVDVDRTGAEKLGCAFYSGMGGEIIPAIYKATKVNPHSSLVSSFQNIYSGIDKGDVIYGVELPNVEVGVVSNREGLIPPSGREALRIMGIRSAREFAASVAAQVLAGEFNLALEITRERLYN
jgi:hypothetical protein